MELQEQYAAMSDAEVFDFYERQKDLTDIARETLMAEFRKRGLKAETTEQEADHEAAEGDTHLWDFVNGIDASEAIALLQHAGIDAYLRPIAKDEKRIDGSQLVVMELYVPEADSDRAVKLLRKHKGLFPLPEQVEDEGFEPDDSDMFVVAEFDDAGDAELASDGLTTAHVPFRKTEEHRDGKTVSLFEVAQKDIDRAGDALERAFEAETSREL